MSKKVLPVIALLIIVLVSVSMVAAQNALPGSGWLSGQQIQNLSESSNASIVFTAYDQQGTPTNCGSQSAPPGGSVNYLTNTSCNVPAGFVGSAVVSADQPIAAIVNVVNSPTGRAGGMYRGTDGADVANNIAFPLVKNNFNNRNTTLYVQNASTNPNNITVKFTIEGTDYTKAYNNVAANAMIVVTGSDAGAPTGKFGSATATGTGALAGTALEHQINVPVGDNLQAYTAFTPSNFDDLAYCPLVRNGHTAANQTTGIQAQNVSGAAQTIQVVYSYRVGNGPTQSKTVTSASIAPGASANFFSADATVGIPAGALGAATVKGMGGGNIAVIVNDAAYNSNPQRQTAYTCFPDSSKSNKIALPLYKEYFNGNTAGIQIQNAGAAGATVTLRYTSTVGNKVVTFSHNTPIPAGASATFFGVSQLIAPAGISVVNGNRTDLVGTYGGVVITSDQPIVAIVNEAPGALGGAPSTQDAKLYEGFNQ